MLATRGPYIILIMGLEDLGLPIRALSIQIRRIDHQIDQIYVFIMLLNTYMISIIIILLYLHSFKLILFIKIRYNKLFEIIIDANRSYIL
jgi:hypothetical protein